MPLWLLMVPVLPTAPCLPARLPTPQVRALASSAELVVTSGGVGPTLDDVTLAGVAQALGLPLTK